MGILSSMVQPQRRGGFASPHVNPTAEMAAAQQVPEAQGGGLLQRIAGFANGAANELLLPTTGLGRLGAYVGAASGGDLGKATMMAMRDQQSTEQAESERGFKQMQMDEMQRKARMPHIQTIGGILGTVDQDNGSFTPTFTAPRPEEAYAAGLGYDPGSTEWTTALKDYVLRGSGPTAYEYDADLEGVRQGNRERLEGVRYGNRAALKGQPTYGQTHQRPKLSIPGGVPTRGGIVTVKTPAEAMRLPKGTKFRTPGGAVKVRP